MDITERLREVPTMGHDAGCVIEAADEIERLRALMNKASPWQKFTRSLKDHPGVPIAAALTLLGFVAGGVFGGAVMSVFWVLVLWTAWDTRN